MAIKHAFLRPWLRHFLVCFPAYCACQGVWDWTRFRHAELAHFSLASFFVDGAVFALFLSLTLAATDQRFRSR
ncbi:hypothetical protein D1Y84_11595 [Acidipila sp. EB88]|nr:hypothetical protein D1Y84_11595 [Acidipila sp. EB88]